MLGELRLRTRSKEALGGASSDAPKVERVEEEADGSTEPTEKGAPGVNSATAMEVSIQTHMKFTAIIKKKLKLMTSCVGINKTQETYAEKHSNQGYGKPFYLAGSSFFS